MSDLKKILRRLLRKPITLTGDEKFTIIDKLLLQGNLEKASAAIENLEKINYGYINPNEVEFSKILLQIYKVKILNGSGKNTEAVEAIKAVNKDIEDLNNSVIQCLAMMEYSNSLFATGEINESAELLDSASSELEKLKFFYPEDYTTNQAQIFNMQSKIQRKKGLFNEALTSGNESLAIYENAGKYYETSEVLNGIGISYASIGETEKAGSYLNRSSVIYEELGNESQLLKIYNNTGYINWQDGKLSDALENFERAIAISRRLGIKPAEAMILLNTGLIYQSKGNLGDAELSFESSIVLFDELGNHANIAKAQLNLAGVYHVMGDLDRALDFTDKSLQTYLEIDSKDEIGDLYSNKGVIYLEKGDFKQSLEFLNKGLDIHQSSGNLLALVTPLYGLVDLFIAMDDSEGAESYLAQLEKVHMELDDNKKIEHMFKVSKAKILIESDRVVKRAEAQTLFTEIADDEDVFQITTTEAMLSLGDLLLQELKQTASEEALTEFKNLIDRLEVVAEGTVDSQQIPTMVQVLMLRSKLSQID
ncbi:MAG: tetratricopeptide repeat protein, partial [Candidatus Heimdallarchaeota archaeon]|nr:tetratricopeptide repeat protein [Candidatus Heimdallarchaeota archaeon]